MKSSPSPLMTHAGWSKPKTQPYWLSTPYIGWCIPMNRCNKMNSSCSASSQEKANLWNAKPVWDGTSKHALYGYSYREGKKDILEMVHQCTPSFNKITTDKLENLIGNINHVAHIITPTRYFLNWICHFMKKGKSWFPQVLHTRQTQYLHLWIDILQWVSNKVVQIKNIVFTAPTVTIWSYAWKYGIVWYNYKVIAWRWITPMNDMAC